MKKINIFLFMLIALAMQSCLHDDKDNFSTSAAERMQARLIADEAVLRAAPNGWVMKYYPNKNLIYGGYTLFMSFGDGNKVKMMSERGGSARIEESFFSLAADSGPVLRFDTHNDLLHYFSEPKNPDGIGPADSGMQGDYEFVIIKATAEKVILRGKKTNNEIIMTPIPADKVWGTEMEPLVKNSNVLAKHSRFEMQVGGVTSETIVYQKYRTLSIDDVIYPYIITATGIDLVKSMEVNGKKINSFKLVEGNSDVVLINEEADVKLLVMFAPLSEQLFGDSWSFVYSQTEQYSKLVFDVIKRDHLTPNNTELIAVVLGPPGENYALSLYSIIDGKLIRDTYFLDVSVIDDNTVKIVFSGYIAGDTANEHYEKLGYKYLLSLVQGTFKLTTPDDPSSPNKIRLENVDKSTWAFTLSRGIVENVYDK